MNKEITTATYKIVADAGGNVYKFYTSPTEQLRYRNTEDFGYCPSVMKKTQVCPN